MVSTCSGYEEGLDEAADRPGFLEEHVVAEQSVEDVDLGAAKIFRQPAQIIGEDELSSGKVTLKDKVVALYGLGSTANVAAVLPVLAEKKVPLISAYTGSPALRKAQEDERILRLIPDGTAINPYRVKVKIPCFTAMIRDTTEIRMAEPARVRSIQRWPGCSSPSCALSASRR